MQKLRDYVHTFDALWDEQGQCRIRSYREQGQPVVIICSELPENKSASITAVVEWLATEIWQVEGCPDSFIWIEHYPAAVSPYEGESFHQVTFVKAPNTQFFGPRWEPMTKQGVENLIGQQID